MSFITFDFQCTGCGKSFPDKLVRRADVDRQSCDDCEEPLRRLPAGPITTFKFGDRAAIKSKKVVSFRD